MRRHRPYPSTRSKVIAAHLRRFNRRIIVDLFGATDRPCFHHSRDCKASSETVTR